MVECAPAPAAHKARRPPSGARPAARARDRRAPLRVDGLRVLPVASGGSFQTIALRDGAVPLPADAGRIASAAAGAGFGLLADDAGSLFSWGRNSEFGRLGVASPDPDLHVSVPAPVYVVGKALRVAAGSNHALALVQEGAARRVYGFGLDDDEQVGTMSSDDRNRPCRVALHGDVADVYCGWSHSAARMADGSLMTWGRGRQGQLGHGYLPESSLPRKVHFPSCHTSAAVVTASLGYDHSVALVDVQNGDSGSVSRFVYTWGGGSHIVSRVSMLPDATVRFVDVSAGCKFSLFLDEHGVVYATGANDVGQLGLGNFQPRSGAAIVSALLKWKVCAISAGHSHATAITACNKIFVWGAGNDLPTEISHRSNHVAPTAGLALFSSSLGTSLIGCDSASNHGLEGSRSDLQNILLRAHLECNGVETSLTHGGAFTLLADRYLNHECACGVEDGVHAGCEKCRIYLHPSVASLLVAQSKLSSIDEVSAVTAHYSRAVVNAIVCTVMARTLNTSDIPVSYQLADLCDELGFGDVDACLSTHLHPFFSLLNSARKRAMHGKASDEVCAVCLEGFGADAGACSSTSHEISLPCRHIFHQDCVSDWVAEKPACPVCLANVPWEFRNALGVVGSKYGGKSSVAEDDILIHCNLAQAGAPETDCDAALAESVTIVFSDDDTGETTSFHGVDSLLLAAHSVAYRRFVADQESVDNRQRCLSWKVSVSFLPSSLCKLAMKDLLTHGADGVHARSSNVPVHWCLQMELLEMCLCLDLAFLSERLESLLADRVRCIDSASLRKLLHFATRLEFHKLKSAVVATCDARRARHSWSTSDYRSREHRRFPVVCHVGMTESAIILSQFDTSPSNERPVQKQRPKKREGRSWFPRVLRLAL